MNIIPSLLPTFILLIVFGLLFYRFVLRNNSKKDITKLESVQRIIELKYFGKINLNKTDDYVDVIIEVNGNEISLDLNFTEESVPEKIMEPTIRFLEDLDETESIAHNQIIYDFKNGRAVNDYIEHHIKEFSDFELQSIGIDPAISFEEKKQQFLNKIHLKRIGIYPEEWDSLAIFDYTISDELTQYVIVVQFNSDGKIVDVYVES